MAGKKNKKNSKKNKLHPDRFAYDIWSFILSLCAFPKEKMNYEEGEKNSYENEKSVSKICALVMNISLYYRDDWKNKFESRLKAYGFDTVEKIENFLTSLLAINPKFKIGKPEVKVRMSLAVYSEMLLFLNYKGIDFDFGQIVNSWSHFFTEKIALCKSTSDEILGNMFTLADKQTALLQWTSTFMQNVASPYGSRDGVSTTYRKETKNEIESKKLEILQLERSMALFFREAIHDKESKPSLPADFESSAVLPGDRESPEPPLNIECGAVGGMELSEREKTRSTGAAGCTYGGKFSGFPGSETSISLPSDHELHKSQMRVDGGGVGRPKVSRTRNRRSSVTEYRSGEKPTSLPGHCKSFAQYAVRRKKISERERTRSTGVAGCRSGEFSTLLPSVSETSISLPGDREPTKQYLRCDEGDVRIRKESRARNRQINVLECGSKEMPSLKGDQKSYKPHLSLEYDDVGEKEASKRERSQPTGVETCRPGERKSSKTSFEIEIEEKLALMDLNRLPEDHDVISSKRNPRN